MSRINNKKYLIYIRKCIYNEIKEIYKFLNCWLVSCSKKKRTIFYRSSVNDVLARKKVNRLEELANKLHIINDLLENKITFSNGNFKFESFELSW